MRTHPDEINRMCSAHGKALVKQRNFAGNIVYVCPRTDCGFKLDSEGEKSF